MLGWKRLRRPRILSLGGANRALDSVNTAMPYLLAIMGVLSTWSAAPGWQRVAWTIGFVIVGLVGVFAAARAQKHIESKILGGDQFFAVSFLYGPGMNPNGKFPLAITNSRQVPIYDAFFTITRKGDFPQNGQQISVGTIYPTDVLRRLSVSLPVGDYTLDIRTKAGGWFFESLELTSTGDGNFHQTYYVRRIGSEQRLMDVP
jgi:hypothetical protein